jgi:hypothetical protein
MTPLARILSDYYRCPEDMLSLFGQPPTAYSSEFFRIDVGKICSASSSRAPFTKSDAEIEFADERVKAPFNPKDVIDALRFERYCKTDKTATQELVWSMYYFIRPLLGVPIRRQLQKVRVRNWRTVSFPAWPVDCTVERLHERLLQLCIEANGATQAPFIWFWPNGHSSCVAMTHDVETTKGRDFCRALIDLDERYEIKASFQLIPEDRYAISKGFLDTIRSRGCEINIHDLNHDGRLFASAAHFPEKAKRINRYAKAFNAHGFRSGALHHNLDWYDALQVSYDMSVPNTARLDPQSGGCCTVLPYFIGDILEIPLTTTQDYSLFNLLDQFSIDLWLSQLDIIRNSHGIATFNIHPDYITAKVERAVYERLLQHLAETRISQNVWHALPGEVDRWWRDRANMRIVKREGSYKIEGSSCERAVLAYARLDGEKLNYFIESQTPQRMRFTG